MNQTVNYSGFSDMFFDAAEQRRAGAATRQRPGKIAAENGSRGRAVTLRQGAGRAPLARNSATTFSED